MLCYLAMGKAKAGEHSTQELYKDQKTISIEYLKWVMFPIRLRWELYPSLLFALTCVAQMVRADV